MEGWMNRSACWDLCFTLPPSNSLKESKHAFYMLFSYNYPLWFVSLPLHQLWSKVTKLLYFSRVKQKVRPLLTKLALQLYHKFHFKCTQPLEKNSPPPDRNATSSVPVSPHKRSYSSTLFSSFLLSLFLSSFLYFSIDAQFFCTHAVL